MSGEVPLPAVPGVQSFDFEVEGNVDAPTSLLSKAMQRQLRSGDRWRGTLAFPPAQGDEAGVLNAWLRQAARGDRWFWLAPPHSFVRGNWNPADLVSNGTFIGGATTGWTAVGSTLSVNARRLKVKNTAGANSQARQNVAMEATKPHALIFDGHRGNATSVRARIIRQSDSASEADTGAFTAPDRRVLLCTPTVSGMTIDLRNESVVAAEYTLFSGVSLTRCLQVAGGAQVGNRLNVDGGPTSINAALKAGEFVCFLVGTRYQLVQLVEDLDTDTGGAGTLVFEPTLRGSPADNAAVIVRYPFGRFLIPDHRAVDVGSSPNFHGFAISVLEDITP